MYSRSEKIKDACREKRDSGWFWSFRLMDNNYKKDKEKQQRQQAKMERKRRKHEPASPVKDSNGYIVGFPPQDKAYRG